MPRKAAAVNPAYHRAAAMTWGYFNTRGLYMQTAFRDALRLCSLTLTARKHREMIAILRRVVDGEDLPTPAASPAMNARKGDQGLEALGLVAATALRAVPGAWEEWARTTGK